MDNRVLLNQARKGIAFQIAQSPESIAVERQPMVPDGFGGLMPEGEPQTLTYVVRISHERSGVQQTQTMPQGLDTSLTLWILGNHTLILREGETITAAGRGRKFRVGVVDALKKFEGIMAYQAPLYPAGEVSDGIVTGVDIDQAAGPFELETAETLQLTATITPAGAIDQAVTWSSSDEDVATVDADGLVTAVGPGSATITVTTHQGSFTDTRVVEVGT
jgi:hypothetical protein